MMIRQATYEDLEQIIPLLMIIFKDMELEALEVFGEEKVKELVYQAAQYEDYRYFYERAIVAEEDGKIVGVAYSYPESDEKTLDEGWERLLKKHHLPNQPLFFEKEALPDEWYLESLVVAPIARGRGIGTKLIQSIEKKAKASRAKYLSLNVDQDNPQAEALYYRNGFEKVTEIILSNHRYNHLRKLVK